MHDHELTKNALVKGQVLFVCGISEDSAEGGTWMSELAVPYTVFKGAGFDVTIASPNGDKVNIDARSLGAEEIKEPRVASFASNDTAMEQMRRSVPLAALTQPATTTQWDLPGAHTLRSLLSDAAASGTLLLANRHGVGALLGAPPPLLHGCSVACRGIDADRSWLCASLTVAGALLQRGEREGESDDDETPLIAFDKEHGVMSGANLSSVEALAERAVAELLAGKHPSASVHVPTSSKPTLTGAEVGRMEGEWGTTDVGRPHATSPKGPATGDTEDSAQLAMPVALECNPRMAGGAVGAGGAGAETSDRSNSCAGLATVPGVLG
ncbi:hypothetical protein FOA52_009302 [Chlamydomonas sp. UWO 241]|nr:hypothetical protein FOA52_009302 [Chlamydomonas sp. UWO 241]